MKVEDYKQQAKPEDPLLQIMDKKTKEAAWTKELITIKEWCFMTNMLWWIFSHSSVNSTIQRNKRTSISLAGGG